MRVRTHIQIHIHTHVYNMIYLYDISYEYTHTYSHRKYAHTLYKNTHAGPVQNLRRLYAKLRTVLHVQYHVYHMKIYTHIHTQTARKYYTKLSTGQPQKRMNI